MKSLPIQALILNILQYVPKSSVPSPESPKPSTMPKGSLKAKLQLDHPEILLIGNTRDPSSVAMGLTCDFKIQVLINAK